MPIENLIEYIGGGVAIFAIASIVFIVREFLKFVKFQEKNFKETVDNHLSENATANKDLSIAVRELLDFLKYHNNNQKKGG